MGSEFDKMVNGEWYDFSKDPSIQESYQQAKQYCYELTQVSPVDNEGVRALLEKLFTVDNLGEGTVIMPPITVDYGINTQFGKECFVNHHCYFMDCAPITLGEHVFVGPNCGFYTAHHPLAYERRNTRIERALPITIGDNVWIGGHVVITPGVTIGSGSVVGAGAVVTHDVPNNVVVAGNPARVIRTLDQTEQD
ncbi:MAG: sugar O-acetyltransferase [Aerococcus sp.]|nr:sugar O-acetyltransferase [Aerococcus sp.]